MRNTTIRHKILTIPGLHNSGPTHWQSLWEHKFEDIERIELGRWAEPDRDEWVRRIAEAIEVESGPVLIAAHSLGCHAFAHWFASASTPTRSRIAGALLVAPADMSRLRHERHITGFADTPTFTSRTPIIVVTFNPAQSITYTVSGTSVLFNSPVPKGTQISVTYEY